MANVNTKEKEAIRQENIEATVSKTEQFLNKYGKTIWITVGTLVVVFLAVLAYSKFIYQPKCQEAMTAAISAEESFRAAEYDLALNGDGNVMGFAQVIDEYGSKAGAAAYLYAGICELQIGNFQEAVNYLKKYNGKEPILSARAKSCLGDAYVGLEDYQSALKAYQAAASEDNVFAAVYLVKEGGVYEKLGQNDKALECYNKVKNDYPQTMEAYEIDKFINRVAE